MIETIDSCCVVDQQKAIALCILCPAELNNNFISFVILLPSLVGMVLWWPWPPRTQMILTIIWPRTTIHRLWLMILVPKEPFNWKWNVMNPVQNKCIRYERAGTLAHTSVARWRTLIGNNGISWSISGGNITNSIEDLFVNRTLTTWVCPFKMHGITFI